MWPAMIDMPTARHFRPEAEAESCHIPSAEPGDMRRRLTGVLLQHAGTDKTRRPGLSWREMAALLGVSRDMVSSSLKSLQAGADIRISRHRIMINKDNKELLEKAGCGVYTIKGGQNGGINEIRQSGHSQNWS